MAVTLTQQAVEHVRQVLSKNPEAVALRFGVKPSGCSGLTYVVGFAEAIAEADTVFEQDGVKVAVDRKSLPFLEGMEVDYIRDGLNKRFDFRNPNVKASCGCGESFAV